MDLSYNRDVTVTGWVGFLTVLCNPNLASEELYLVGHHINDHVIMTSFAGALANNNMRRELNLDLYVTTLEVLDLGTIPINDLVMISFADALSNNCRLRKLVLAIYDTDSVTTPLTLCTISPLMAFQHIPAICATTQTSLACTIPIIHLRNSAINLMKVLSLKISTLFCESTEKTAIAKLHASRSSRLTSVGVTSTHISSLTWR